MSNRYTFGLSKRLLGYVDWSIDYERKNEWATKAHHRMSEVRVVEGYVREDCADRLDVILEAEGLGTKRQRERIVREIRTGRAPQKRKPKKDANQ